MDLWGYTWEPHKITTDDGFILTTFHLTGKVNEETEPRTESLMPVVLKHGYLCDSVTWFGNPDEYVMKPIPIRLFDDGFDIWLGNDRGTQYCQEHITMNKHEPEFWSWSWAEMGIYDDVANVEYIKNITEKDKVSYLGVS